MCCKVQPAWQHVIKLVQTDRDKRDGYISCTRPLQNLSFTTSISHFALLQLSSWWQKICSAPPSRPSSILLARQVHHHDSAPEQPENRMTPSLLKNLSRAQISSTYIDRTGVLSSDRKKASKAGPAEEAQAQASRGLVALAGRSTLLHFLTETTASCSAASCIHGFSQKSQAKSQKFLPLGVAFGAVGGFLEACAIILRLSSLSECESKNACKFIKQAAHSKCGKCGGRDMERHHILKVSKSLEWLCYRL